MWSWVSFYYLPCPGGKCSSGFQLDSYLISFQVTSVPSPCWSQHWVPLTGSSFKSLGIWSLPTLCFRVHNWKWDFSSSHKNIMRVSESFGRDGKGAPETSYSRRGFAVAQLPKGSWGLENAIMEIRPFVSQFPVTDYYRGETKCCPVCVSCQEELFWCGIFCYQF